MEGCIIVTGANGGLGSAFANALLSSPEGKRYKSLFTVRNPGTANDLNKILSKNVNSGADTEIIALDLSDISNIRRAALDINLRVASGALPPIRAIVCNAAYQDAHAATSVAQQFTKDGIEMAFGVNHIAHFLLVLLLLKSMDRQYGRIVMVSSWTHDPSDAQNSANGLYDPLEKYRNIFPDGGDPVSELKKNGGALIAGDHDGYKIGMRRYGLSKLCQIMFAHDLQHRLASDPQLSNIKVLAVDPGGMGTTLTRTSPLYIRFLTYILIPVLSGIMVWFSPNGMIRTPRKSANDLMLACFSEAPGGSKLADHQGGDAVYLNGSALSKSSAKSMDRGKQIYLWNGSAELVGLKDEETILQIRRR